MFNIKMEYKKIHPFGIFDNEIRRKYYLFNTLLYKTKWFKLSKLWPGFCLTGEQLEKTGVKKFDIY